MYLFVQLFKMLVLLKDSAGEIPKHKWRRERHFEKGSSLKTRKDLLQQFSCTNEKYFKFLKNLLVNPVVKLLGTTEQHALLYTVKVPAIPGNNSTSTIVYIFLITRRDTKADYRIAIGYFC